MTYGTETLGTVSAGNSLTLINGTNTTEYNLYHGNVISATSTTAVLDGSASGTDDVYNTHVIEIISGKGKGQALDILDYTGSTKTLTFTNQWKIIPDTSSKYVIHVNSGTAAEQTQAETDLTIKLKPSESTVDGFFQKAFIKIIDGTGANQIREIIEYNGSTLTAKIEKSWDTLPDDTSLYAIFGEGGTCPDQSAATSTTIILDGNQSQSATSQYMSIEIYSGTGISQFRTVSSISVNTLTITPAWDVQPTQNDKYIFFGGCTGIYEEVKDYSSISVSGTANIVDGEKVIIEYESSIDSKGADRNVSYVESSSSFPRNRQLTVVTARYFRLKVIGMGTVVNATVQTIYHSKKGGTLSVETEEQIFSNNPARLVRSIMVGKNASNRYKNISLDYNDNIYTSIVNPLSAFGEVLSVHLEPVTQINYVFGVNSNKVETFVSHGTYMTVDVEGDVGVSLVQSIYFPAASTFNSSGAGHYFTLETSAPASYYVWFNVDSGNTDPAPGGTGITVAVSAGDSASTLASAVQSAVDADAAFSASVFASVVTITNTATGAAVSAHLDNMPNTSGGSVSWNKLESGADVSIGSALADYAVLRSRRALVYRNGQGSDIRFTAIFDNPTSGVEQFVGGANSSCGLYIGYDGTDFQINRRSKGQHEIRELTITDVTSATTGTVFITVDGIRHMETLTDVSSVQSVAAQLAQHDYSRGLYLAEYVNDKIIFMSERQNAQTGNNSFSFSLGTATNITASWEQITSSVVQERDAISQSSWNIDRMDGTGPSGQILNPQTGNVYRLTFQWLGFGSITFSVENKETGRFSPIHIIKYTNTNTSVSLSQPALQFTAYCASTFSTAPITLKTNSCGLFVQGGIKRLDPVFSHANTHVGLDVANTNKIFFALRNPRIFNGKGSQVEIFLRNISVATTKSANATRAIINVYIVEGGTPSQNLVYNYVEEKESAIFVADTSYSDPLTLTGGHVIFSTVITSEGAVTIDLTSINLLINKQTTAYVIYSNSSPSGSGVIDLGVDLSWVEDH